MPPLPTRERPESPTGWIGPSWKAFGSHQETAWTSCWVQKEVGDVQKQFQERRAATATSKGKRPAVSLFKNTWFCDGLGCFLCCDFVSLNKSLLLFISKHLKLASLVVVHWFASAELFAEEYFRSALNRAPLLWISVLFLEIWSFRTLATWTAWRSLERLRTITRFLGRMEGYKLLVESQIQDCRKASEIWGHGQKRDQTNFTKNYQSRSD